MQLTFVLYQNYVTQGEPNFRVLRHISYPLYCKSKTKHITVQYIKYLLVLNQVAIRIRVLPHDLISSDLPTILEYCLRISIIF